MKKIIIAAAVVLGSTVVLSSCTKENVKPAASVSAKIVAEKGDVAQADITSTDNGSGL